MARIRSIKPEFWESETIGRRSLLARLTFIGLWNLADDMGRGRGESGAIWGRLHSYQGSATKARWKRALSELQKPDRDGIPFVVFYKIGLVSYFWIPTFYIHQKIDHPTPSKLPPCPQEPELLARIRERFALEQGAGSREQGEEQGGEGAPPHLGGSPGDGFGGSPSDVEIAEAYCKLDPTVPRPKVLAQVRRALSEGVRLEELKKAIEEKGDRLKIWAIKDLLLERPGRRNGASSGSPRVSPENPGYLAVPRVEAQAKQDAARAACDEKLSAMPTEEIAQWTREAEAQAVEQRIPGPGVKLWVTGALRRRAAEKFGIEGL